MISAKNESAVPTSVYKFLAYELKFEASQDSILIPPQSGGRGFTNGETIMETSEAKSAAKPKVKKSTSSTIRVAFETRKKILIELTKINKKQFGKRVKLDSLIVCLLTKLTAQDVSDLQEASLTGRDRIERRYKAHCAKFGQITMDEYLGILIGADSPKASGENTVVSEGKNGV